MPDEAQRRPGFPAFTLLLCLLALGLTVMLLGQALGPDGGSGEARMGDAFATLFLTAGLWLVLSVLVLVAGMLGRMPRHAAIAAFFLLPFSLVAAVVALDMASRHHAWAVVFPVLLSLLTIAYALWARLPRAQAMLAAPVAGLLGGGGIFALSVLACVLACYI